MQVLCDNTRFPMWWIQCNEYWMSRTNLRSSCTSIHDAIQANCRTVMTIPRYIQNQDAKLSTVTHEAKNFTNWSVRSNSINHNDSQVGKSLNCPKVSPHGYWKYRNGEIYKTYATNHPNRKTFLRDMARTLTTFSSINPSLKNIMYGVQPSSL